jgi:uncharacterized repeat protein (TIGR02543 family)
VIKYNRANNKNKKQKGDTKMKKHIVSLLAILLVVILSMTSCGILGGGGDSELVEYLESRIEELEAELDELKKENSNKDNEIDKLKEENSEKDKEIGNLKDDNSSKDEEISDLKAEIKKLQDEIATLESKDAENLAKITELETAYNNKVAELEANKQANEGALAKLEADHKAEVEGLEGDIAELETAYNNKVAELEANKQANADALASLEASHKAEVEGLEGDIAELEAAYNSKVAELEAEKAANAEALAKLEAEYKAKVEALEAENANLALQIKDLEARVQEFINNTKYTVTFDFNDEKSEILSQTIKYGKTVDEPESPKKDHYKFIGWYVNDVKAEFPYVVTSDLDFVAVYEPVKYTITYNANSGTMPDTYTTEYTAETEIILPIPYLDLFSFEGWYESSDFSGNKITKISADEYGNKTFHAKWKSATNDGLTYQPSSDGSYLIVTGYEGTETSIVIPNSVGGIPVTHIAKEAFKDKQRLVSITVPDSITIIGDGAFQGCISLEELNLGNGLTAIPSYMANGCTKLASIVIPYSVTNINSYAFRACYNLTSVVIPDSTITIGSCAFYECSSLFDVTIGKSVTSIGSSAFYLCGSLSNVIIGDSVTTIGSNAFHFCYGLTKIDIPDSVTSIGYSAFGYCSLDSINVGINNARYYVEGNCLIEKETKTVIAGTNNSVIPDGIISIAAFAFSGREKLSVIKIPDSAVNIEESAFASCFNITNVVIGDNVSTIGGGVFWQCWNICSVEIGKSVTSIGDSAFFDCKNILIVFNNSNLLLELGSNSNGGIVKNAKVIVDGENILDANDEYEYITTNDGFFFRKKDSKYELIAYTGDKDPVILPDNINGNSYEIYEMRGVRNVIIPEAVTRISDNAFKNCSTLIGVVIPDSVTVIGSYVFYGCESLINIVIPDSVTSVGAYAFSGCESLADITIPNSVASIGDSAFWGCNNLTNLYINNLSNWCNISFGSAYSNPLCYANNFYIDEELVTELIIPNGVSSIGDYSFYNFDCLTSAEIPDSITIIGKGAFYDCDNLNIIVIPNSVTFIYTDAFGACDSLANIVVEETNCYYKSIDGHLYGKDGKTLIQYAIGKEGASFEIPNSVTTIGSEAFSWCKNLTHIVISDSVTVIGIRAFYNCDSLTNVVIGGNVVSISLWAFDYCNQIANVFYIGTAEGWSEISTYSYIVDDATIYYYSETHPTEEGNFWHWVDGEPTVWCYDPASIPAVDATCTETGLSEGKYCEACGETLVAQNITDVKHNFVNNICVECGEVYYSKGLVYTSNGDGTCYLSGIGTCTDTDISIPLVSPDGDIVTGIGYSAFSSCRNITSVTIPDSVTDIGDCAFQYCDNLKEVNINNLNVHVGSDAFNRCHSDLYTDYEYGRYVRVNDNPYAILVKILNTYYATYKIHEDTCVISENLFQYHSQLTSIIIPDKVKNIGNGAFYYCSNLSSVTLGKGVTRIGEDAFYRCISMTSINLPDGLVEICEDAFWITGLTSIVIPDSVTSIGNHAFEACDYLRTVVIGNGVTDIGIWAFCGCDNLSSVIIGNSVVNIGLGAFAGCTSLKNIVMSSNVSIIGDIAFRNCPYLSKVYFDGSEEDWNLINISSDENSDFTDATRYYYSETEPTEEGNFWHWVDGEVVIWE